MKAIPIKNIFKLSLAEILELKKSLPILFEDGTIVDAYYKDIILFRFLLDFQYKFEFSITSDLWVTNYYTNGFFTNGTYLSIYSLVFRKIVEVSGRKDNNDLLASLFESMYIAITNINNVLVVDKIDYAIGIEILDVLDIQFDERIIGGIINSAKEKTVAAVENTYNVLDEVMVSEKYDGNPVRLAYQSRAISIAQIRQLLGSRGFLTEISSKIFNIPMTNSFALGFKNMYDAAIESRAGAKALYLSSKAIQDSEYMARELQLATMTVEDVYFGDCGHPTYEDFYVRPREVDVTGKEIYKGDLGNLVGKRYLDIDGVEKIVTKKDTHLIGNNIKLRMAVYCGLRNKKQVCSACIGEVANSIFKHQNLGHIATTNASAKVTQSILSTKHLLMSATSAVIRLTEDAKRYFMIKNNEYMYFKANVVGKKVKEVYVKFKQSEAWGLSNALQVKDVFSINVNKISRLSSIILVFKTKKGVEERVINLKYGNRYAFFTREFISYVLNSELTIDDEEYYSVDINNYDQKNPIFMYERQEFDFPALAAEFKSKLKTQKYKYINGKVRSEYVPHVLVQDLFTLINSKLDINIALLDVMVYAFTVQDLTTRNYDLGRNSRHRHVAGFKEVIDGRSIGSAYDWDNLQNKVLDPIMYVENNKCSHPLDVFFCPNEVVANEGN